MPRGARTSFLDAGGSSFFIEFTSFWSSKVCEQFVTAPELFFVVMHLIHTTLCFSGYNHVRCVHWISYWWSRNFYPMHVRQEFSQYELPKLVQWLCLSGIAADTWLVEKRSRTRVFSAQRSTCSPSVVFIWSNFVLLPGCRTILEVSFFRIIVSSILTASDSKLRTCSRILFPVAGVWRDTKSCTSSGFNLVKILLSTGRLARPFSSSVKPNGWHQLATAP